MKFPSGSTTPYMYMSTQHLRGWKHHDICVYVNRAVKGLNSENMFILLIVNNYLWKKEFPINGKKGTLISYFSKLAKHHLGRPKIRTFSDIKLLFCPFVLQGKGIICGYVPTMVHRNLRWIASSILHTPFRSVYPPHWQWPASIGSWRVFSIIQ